VGLNALRSKGEWLVMCVEVVGGENNCFWIWGETFGEKHQK